MFKNFLSAIVGTEDEVPAAKPAPRSPDPQRPPSQPASGRSTPMSETGSTFGGGRRGSNASSQSQVSPVGMGDLDLSSLSAEEKAQIEAVIARAKEMQQDGEQRVRDIEEEFGSRLPASPNPKEPIKPTATHHNVMRPSTLGQSAEKHPPQTLPKPGDKVEDKSDTQKNVNLSKSQNVKGSKSDQTNVGFQPVSSINKMTGSQMDYMSQQSKTAHNLEINTGKSLHGNSDKQKKDKTKLHQDSLPTADNKKRNSYK